MCKECKTKVLMSPRCKDYKFIALIRTSGLYSTLYAKTEEGLERLITTAKSKGGKLSAKGELA